MRSSIIDQEPLDAKFYWENSKPSASDKRLTRAGYISCGIVIQMAAMMGKPGFHRSRRRLEIQPLLGKAGTGMGRLHGLGT